MSDENSEAVKIGKKVGLILSRGQRSNSDMRFRGKDVPHKRYTVMPWAGPDLYQHTLDPTQAQLVALKMCLILHSLHKINIIHIDIKPENISFTINPNNPYDIDVKFLDYDVAREVPQGGESVNEKKVIGTIWFLAQEILDEKRYSKASDIYALVCSLLLEGLIPTEIPDRVYNGLFIDEIPLREYLNQHKVKFGPAAYDQMIRKYLSPNPAERPSLNELIHYLCCLLENDPNLDTDMKSKIDEVKLEFSRSIQSSQPPQPWYAPVFNFLPAWLTFSRKKEEDRPLPSEGPFKSKKIPLEEIEVDPSGVQLMRPFGSRKRPHEEEKVDPSGVQLQRPLKRIKKDV
ncbi:MAG: protein kinase [Candidatus Berkiellales bacterium]